MSTSLKRKAADLPGSSSKKPKANATITSFFAAPKQPASSPISKNDDAKNEVEPSSSKSSPPPSSAPPQPPSSTNTVSAFSSLGAPSPAQKFDKKAWVEKLPQEQKDLLALEIHSLHETWLAVLKEEILTKEFLELKRFLKREREAGKTIFPPAEDVYSWHTPLPSVKAVIIGQDPYHNINQAHGLCFSVRAPTPAPPSLKNMYIALKKDYPTFMSPPKNGGLLTPWADRGVLLLNTCLTVRAHEANSHAGKGWERFTQKVIDIVAQRRTKGVVFLAWGKPAGERVKKVDKLRHCILQSVHPSPLSAARGFFDCGHFKKTNEWLKQRYGEDGEIDWNLDVPPVEAGV
ncbi:MAG: hypothetical protein Q9195_000024 [Heterodermia aff. obscurata]